LADPKSFVLFQWQQRDRFLGNSALSQHFSPTLKDLEGNHLVNGPGRKP
jgi:hypothetical protein